MQNTSSTLAILVTISAGESRITLAMEGPGSTFFIRKLRLTRTVKFLWRIRNKKNVFGTITYKYFAHTEGNPLL